MLDSLTGRVPETAPRDYVTGLFDDYADRFDNAIDLGCGSGLVGIQLRPLVGRMSGVDLSSGMLENAREKKICDVLVRADIIEFLDVTEERYDLFTAADLFIYVGNLESVFSAVSGAAMAGAWFVFSTEATEQANYTLNETGGYSHSKSYIELLSRKFGFAVRSCQAESIRTQSGRPVAGYLYVLQLEELGPE